MTATELVVPAMEAAIVIAVLLTGEPTALAGQVGIVRGRVVRADAAVGVSDAQLTLRPSGAATRSDANGYFEFDGVAAGEVELAVHRDGFISATVALRVEALAATEVEILLEPVAAMLDPLVAWADRDARSVGESAGAVSVADTSAIERGPTAGLHETLRLMPGVQVASRYGTSDVSIGIRGSAAQALPVVRGVTVLLDRVPLTEPEGRTQVDFIELAAARRVEVVRGPASALYSASGGGVVNIVSRTGRDSPGTTVRAQGGSFGFRKYDARAGALFAGGRGSAFAAGSYTSTDGYRAHSDADDLRGHLELDYLAGRDTRVSLEATGSRFDARVPGPLTESQFDADPDAAAPAAELFGLRRIHHRYRAGARVESAVGNAVATGYVFYGGWTLFLPLPPEIVSPDSHRMQGGARLRTGRVGHLALAATVGFDYDRLFGTDRRWENHGGVAGALLDHGRYSVPGLGAYAQTEWQPIAPLTTTFGLRYDRVTYRFEGDMPGGVPRQETMVGQASPRITVRWGPDPATSVYASVGRGFEVPTVADLSSRPSQPIHPARPKSLWNYELGGHRAIGDGVRVDVAAFVAAVRGEFVPVTVDGMDLIESASRSRNVGAELSIAARAARWLDLAASYTFLDLRLREYTTFVLDSTGTRTQVDFSGKRVPAVPSQRLTAEARLRPLRRLDVGVQLEWQGVVYVETGNAERGTWYFQLDPAGPVQGVPFRAVPARALVHLNAAYHAGAATLFGNVENLFDRRYTANVSANESFGRFYQAGSPAWVSLGISVTRSGPNSGGNR